MIYQKPPAIDVDAWEKLGSPGWDWAHHHAATKNAEKYVLLYDRCGRVPRSQLMYHSFHPPSEDEIEKFALKFNPESFGSKGRSRSFRGHSECSQRGIYWQVLFNFATPKL